jgi:hypothetical protein
LCLLQHSALQVLFCLGQKAFSINSCFRCCHVCAVCADNSTNCSW